MIDSVKQPLTTTNPVDAKKITGNSLLTLMKLVHFNLLENKQSIEVFCEDTIHEIHPIRQAMLHPSRNWTYLF